MSAERNLSDHDYELLSAYIDGALTDSERATLEQQLAVDDLLRDELEQLYRTVQWINQMPTLQAPRNFTLDATMVETLESRPKIVPMPKPTRRVASFNYMGIAAAVAVVLFAGILVISMLGPSVGSTFSNIVSGLNSGGASSADGVAVAQNPTPLPAPSETLSEPQPNGRSVGEESATPQSNGEGVGQQVDTQTGAAAPTVPQDAIGAAAVDGEVNMDDEAGLDEAESSQTSTDTDAVGDISLAPPATFNESQPAPAGGTGGGLPNTGGGGTNDQATDSASTVTAAPGNTTAYSATQAESAVGAAVPEMDLSDTTGERIRSAPELVLRTLVIILIATVVTMLNLITGSGR